MGTVNGSHNKNNINRMRRRSLQVPSARTTIYKPANITSSRYSRPANPLSKSINLESTDIYFNEERRKVHIKSIIDSYFESHHVEQKHEEAQSKPMEMRRRASLINRNCSDRLANTCPQPFHPMSHSDVVEFNKTFLSDQSLPPIVETTDDPEIANSSFYNMSLSTLIEEAKNDEKSRLIENTAFLKRRPKLISENEMYRLMHVFHGQSKMPVSLVKEYKTECREIFMREQKVWGMLSSMEVKRMWVPTSLLGCQARPLKSLKSMLMELARESVMAENVYKINLKPYYDQMFANDNEIIKMIVCEVCRQLNTVKGKIINNRISLGNIYKDGDDIVIGQWGHSAIMETAKIASETVTNIMNPVLKGFKEWFVTPEYLPPQMLEHVCGQTEIDMWQSPSAIDMWSLGCMLLELFTLVPLWSPLRCQISNRPNLTRRGLFHSKARELPQIATKQKKFCSNLKLHLDRLAEVDSRATKKLVDVMIKMLQVDPRCRPSPQQVISLLN